MSIKNPDKIYLNESWPELVLALEIDVDEVTLPDLTGDGVQLAVVAGDDGQESGQLVVDEVVVVLTVVERVHHQSVEESALVLGLSHDEGDLGEAALDEEVLGSVGQHNAVDGRCEPTWEGKEHLVGKHYIINGLFVYLKKWYRMEH